MNLKQQVPRLRDWNYAVMLLELVAELLETTSTSITRLKHISRLNALIQVQTWNNKYLDYEIETQRGFKSFYQLPSFLKQQVPRLRDWNPLIFIFRCEKICSLETTSTSITRLKRFCGRRYGWRCGSWNNKYLDYEIETNPFTAANDFERHLETTSTSITRLKLACDARRNPPL